MIDCALDTQALSDAEVRRFQETGEIVVEGHLLSREDVQVCTWFALLVNRFLYRCSLFFSFCDGQVVHSVDPSVSSRYAAHADREFLILLDVTPSQDILDEGVAREVINKVQKLRKKVSRRMMEKGAA